MKCKHNFVKSGYGNDMICTKCGYAAMQATINPSVNLSESINVRPIISKDLLKRDYLGVAVSGRNES